VESSPHSRECLGCGEQNLDDHELWVHDKRHYFEVLEEFDVSSRPVRPEPRQNPPNLRLVQGSVSEENVERPDDL
jgi:hypothetical protein